MHYFDSRGVFRVYEVSVRTGELGFWRDAPGMSQRYTATLDAGRNTITSRGKMSRDGGTWDADLSTTFRRVR